MKNEIEMPDDLDFCDECGIEYPKNKIRACPGCRSKICPDCMDLHSDEHYQEEREREKEKE